MCSEFSSTLIYNMKHLWFSSTSPLGLTVLSRPCFETMRFFFFWAWITPKIPRDFRAKGFHLKFDCLSIRIKRVLIFVFVFTLLTVLRLNDVSQMAFLLLQPNKQNLTFYSWKAIGERKCWLILQYLIDIIKRKC